MKGVKKQNLPSKICIVCQKPFAWRKKWAKNWELVKYCSDRCRSNNRTVSVGNDPRSNRYFNIEKQANNYDKDKSYRNLWLVKEG